MVFYCSSKDRSFQSRSLVQTSPVSFACRQPKIKNQFHWQQNKQDRISLTVSSETKCPTDCFRKRRSNGDHSCPLTILYSISNDNCCIDRSQCLQLKSKRHEARWWRNPLTIRNFRSMTRNLSSSASGRKMIRRKLGIVLCDNRRGYAVKPPRSFFPVWLPGTIPIINLRTVSRSFPNIKRPSFAFISRLISMFFCGFHSSIRFQSLC